jgi:hypothetical protein
MDAALALAKLHRLPYGRAFSAFQIVTGYLYDVALALPKIATGYSLLPVKGARGCFAVSVCLRVWSP